MLLSAEQGLGDTLQLMRYAARARRGGGRVLLECQPALIRLLAQRSHHECCDQVIALGGPLPEHDVQAALMSLPSLLRTTPVDAPAEVPYLFADRELTECWRQRMAGVKGFKVGIAWQGNPNWVGDRYRSVPLERFQPLAELPFIRLINLQTGPGAEQLAAVSHRFEVIDYGRTVDVAAGPFVDTAAMMSGLDLVVTSDTSIAHLAGALGVPVWVALPFAPDWRWLMDRGDSPWYPTMRLFRQRRPGDWHGVFGEMARSLGERIAHRGRQDVVLHGSLASPYQPEAQARTNKGPTDRPYQPEAQARTLEGPTISPYQPEAQVRTNVAHNGAGHAGGLSKKPITTINLSCPINHLGYGVVSLNLLKGLTRAGVRVACWPIGRIDVEGEDRAFVEEAIGRQKGFDGHAPSVRVAH